MTTKRRVAYIPTLAEYPAPFVRRWKNQGNQKDKAPSGVRLPKGDKS